VFLVMVVGRVYRCSLSNTIFFGWACLQDTCFLDNGRDKPEQDTQMLDFLEERGTGTSRAENRL
jgi:hypothetical protein